MGARRSQRIGYSGPVRAIDEGDGMTDTTFLSASPKFLTRDLARTADFYTQHVGFEVVSMYPDYLIIRRGDVWLHFGLAPDTDPKTNQCSAYIYVKGIDVLYEQCKTEGILRQNAWLRDQSYGVRDFSLIDLDGNLLTFGELIPRAES
jgi:catechol 2,3-dioxygenase-like lactoylglutathione lyase family enzyme